MKIKTKNILLGLGATTALVGTSFAIVSCADDTSEPKNKTINYSQEGFMKSKTNHEGNPLANTADYAEYYSDMNLESKLINFKNIFSFALEGSGDDGPIDDGSIDEWKIEADGEDKIKFTFIANPKFELVKNTFVINYIDESETN